MGIPLPLDVNPIGRGAARPPVPQQAGRIETMSFEQANCRQIRSISLSGLFQSLAVMGGIGSGCGSTGFAHPPESWPYSVSRSLKPSPISMISSFLVS